MRVREPFGYSVAKTYNVAEIAADLGADFVQDAFKRLDAENSTVHTEQGAGSSTTRCCWHWGPACDPRSATA